MSPPKSALMSPLAKKILSSLAIILFIIGTTYSFNPNVFAYAAEALSKAKFHAPNLALLAEQSLAIKIHLAGVAFAIIVTLIQFLGPKGTIPHRLLGWLWVIFMGVAAGSSFFIRQINNGQLSFIHILSVATLINLPLVIYYARKGNIKAHQSVVTGLAIGGLLVAGLFTFLPGRLMWQLFFG